MITRIVIGIIVFLFSFNIAVAKNHPAISFPFTLNSPGKVELIGSSIRINLTTHGKISDPIVMVCGSVKTVMQANQYAECEDLDLNGEYYLELTEDNFKNGSSGYMIVPW